MLYRGGHRLPDVSQSCCVDWDAATIARHYGGRTLGGRDRVRGRDQLVVFFPGGCSRWQVFPSWEDLRVWADAYGCEVEPERPTRPHLFTIQFPASEADMQPLRAAEEASVR